MPITPLSSRLAAATQMLPGPVTRSTGSQTGSPIGPVRRGTVGEHRDRLSAADGVHLVDPEQGARGQDGRVRQAREVRGVVPLRRAGDGDRVDAGLLGGDDVHDDAARVDRQAAGHVEADPADRHPALGDRAARRRPGWCGRCGAARGARARARRIDSSRAARTAGSRPASARGSASAGTRIEASRTPSNRSAARRGRRRPARARRRRSGGPARARPRRRGRPGAHPAQRARSGPGRAGRFAGSRRWGRCWRCREPCAQV